MPTYTTTNSNGDILLAQALPEAEYMYGCTPTAVAMVLGYYDLYGYRGTDLSNMIEGDVDSKSRGTDGNAYNMNAFDTALGRATATESFVSRFHARDGKETTPKQELKYAFKSDKKTIDTSVWDCLADYLGTGQYWRGNDNLSTTLTYGSLEDLYDDKSSFEITAGSTRRTIRHVDTAMLYGLDLYVQSRGYAMDYEITGNYVVDVAGGSFTFADYMREIDAGRPVMISVRGHSMAGYGYNAETQEIIFDDCYVSGRRMKWNGTYRFDKVDRELQSITVIGINVNGSVDLALEPVSGGGEKLIAAGTPDARESEEFCFAGNTVYLSFTVSNLGTKDSGEFGAVVRVDGETVSSGTLDALAGRASRGIANLSLGELSVGLHNVHVVLDETNEIQELTGSNNAAETDVLVLKPGASIVSSFLTVNMQKTVQNLCVLGGGRLALATDGQADGGVLHGMLSSGADGSSSRIYAEAIVSQGGSASGTDVYAYASVNVSSGGFAADTRVFSKGAAYVRNGGTASGIEVGSGGRLTVSSGGRLTGQIRIAEGGSARVSNGGIVDFDISALAPGAGARVNDLSRLTGTPVYTLTVFGAQANGVYRLADGAAGFDKSITIRDTNGVALRTLRAGETAAWNGMDYALSLDGDALNLAISGTPLADLVAPTVSGIRADVTAPTCRSVTVTAVFADDVALASAWYRIGKNGLWTQYTDGVTVSENATIFFKAVDAAGNESEIVSRTVSNITSSGCTFSSGQTVDVVSGRVFTNTVLSGGTMRVLSGGAADETKVKDGGCAEILSGGTATGITVEDGGRLAVDDGGTVTGRMSFAPGADISFSSLAVLDFDISALAPGDAAPVNSLSFVQGTPNITLTVSALQRKGVYRIADGAGEFDATISVRDAAGPLSATLEIGRTVDIDGMGYSLNRSDGALTLTIGAAGIDNAADCGWNDWLYDKKTKAVNPRIRDAAPTALNDGTTKLLFDSEGSVLKDGRDNFVGFGDEADFLKISLDSVAKLRFTVDATDAAKFVICRLTETGTDKYGNPTYQYKALQTTSLTKKNGFSALTKSLLLRKGEYYIAMRSTSAKTAASAYYGVTLAKGEGGSVFFTDGDDGGNDWLYDKKTKQANSAVLEAAGIALTPGGIRIDAETPSGEGSDGWENFVGFGDEADYAKLDLSAASKVKFTVTASGAAKIVIYSLTVTGTDRNGDPIYKLKTVLTKTLKKKKNGDAYIYTATTKAVSLSAVENRAYFIAVKSTAAAKGRTAYYNVSLDMIETAAGSSLAMPETSDAPAMTDSLSFGQYAADADILADASASSLADLDGISSRLPPLLA